MKHSIVHRMRLFAILAATVLAFAGFAHAEAVGTQNPQKVEKAKKGTLHVASVVSIGELRLEPGEYEVKQVNSAAGAVVRFTRVTYSPYTGEGGSSTEWETVGEVKVTIQALAGKAKHTGLLLGANGVTAIGMEIRGNSVDYLF